MLTCHWKWNYIHVPTQMNFMNIGIIVKTTLTDCSWNKELLPKNYIKKILFNFSDSSFRTYIFLYSNGNIVYSYLLSLSLYLLVCFICIEKKFLTSLLVIYLETQSPFASDIIDNIWLNMFVVLLTIEKQNICRSKKKNPSKWYINVTFTLADMILQSFVDKKINTFSSCQILDPKI